jgi:small subunit ribosomal protein S9
MAKDTKAAPQINYTWGTGRRKSAVARVRISAGTGQWKVNDLKLEQYFVTPDQRARLGLPLKTTETEGKFDIHVSCLGGGKNAQADAVVMGLARALTKLNPDLDAALKAEGLMTRDARMKERKKYGLHGARKGVQFSKR